MIRTFDDYQLSAARTANTSQGIYRLAASGMGIAGEAGEVCDYLKKVAFHGHSLDQEKILEELGDVLWYIADIASAAGLTLSEIATYNTHKLKNRYPEGFDPERSANRDD